MLRKVQIADPGSVMRRYPHQLSGGMQQRVVIAMALASNPSLLILDEPTTGLDATVEAEVLELIAGLRRELGTSVLFISHNLAVVSMLCDRVGVLYAGRLIEEGRRPRVFVEPRHPYTIGLLRCIPAARRRKGSGAALYDPRPPSEHPDAYLRAASLRIDAGLPRTSAGGQSRLSRAVARASRSRCHFYERAADLLGEPSEPGTIAGVVPGQAPLVRAPERQQDVPPGRPECQGLAEVSIDVMPGETVGLVGESGSGKSTLARILLGLSILMQGSTDQLDGPARPRDRRARSTDDVRAIQIVFQNPDLALNRRFSVRRIIGRAVKKLARLAEGRSRSRRVARTERGCTARRALA